MLAIQAPAIADRFARGTPSFFGSVRSGSSDGVRGGVCSKAKQTNVGVNYAQGNIWLNREPSVDGGYRIMARSRTDPGTL